MTPADPKLVKHLFDEAVEMPRERRAAFLDRACAGDAALRARVQSLLDALDSAPAFLESPTEGGGQAETDATPQTPLSEGPGARIGPYKLLQLLGEGGFGAVFMAEQENPVRRMVALKIIKLGMDTKQVIARFEAERQALAMMDHPNIAKVLDAGATETGRPYFVMELVRGVPITEYCDTANLSTAERLALFIPVCHAVQHAHQKGIIHRDVKPSNVLITLHDGVPVPEVIDFGIAKATHGRLTEKTLFTEHRQMIGTPEYMSPEQAEMNGLDIDTRSDIYSLGVLLYELLTGVTPFDGQKLRSVAYSEIQRIIREVEPPKPSTRISALGATLAAIAAHRGTEPRKLGMLMRGDLDWIVMKAMEKDRTRRYETANGLAMDVQRHLTGEAVVAAPPSKAYRLRKFVRRNKGVFAAGMAVAGALLVGMAGFAWQAHRAGIERDRAQSVTDFVVKSLQSQDPTEQGKQDMTVAEAMTRAADRLNQGDLKDQPATEALLLRTISEILNDNSRSAEAEAPAERALRIEQRLHTGDHPDVATSLRDLASVRRSLGHWAEAEPLFRQALEMRQRLFSGDNVDVAQGLSNLALVLDSMRRNAEAEPLDQQALEMVQRLFKGDHPIVALCLHNLAHVREALGQYPEAERLYIQSLEMTRRLCTGDDPDLAHSLSDLAHVREAQGHAAEAEPLFVQALEMEQRLFKGDHQDVAHMLHDLAHVRVSLGRASEAEPLYVRALEMRQRLFKGDDPGVATTMKHLARCLAAQGRLPEALGRAQQAADMAARMLPPGDPIRKTFDEVLAEIKKKMAAAGDAATPPAEPTPPPGD